MRWAMTLGKYITEFRDLGWRDMMHLGRAGQGGLVDGETRVESLVSFKNV